jgi:phage repressor protein C with HTH and peptisase S24 domain
MEPTLRDGDWLLVDPLGYRAAGPQPGQLVVADDPRAAGRRVIKRIAAVAPDGSLRLVGDHPAHAADELSVSAAAIRGRPWFRYWPARRLGRLR